MIRLYLSSPLRDSDRKYTDTVKETLEKLNLFYFKHDQFATKLDAAKVKQSSFAGKEYNIYPDDIAKEIAYTEYNELDNTDGLIVVLPSYYHECTTGVAVEIGYAIARHIPILLFIDKTRPIDNLSLTIKFYEKLSIAYIEDNLEDTILKFIRGIYE